MGTVIRGLNLVGLYLIVWGSLWSWLTVLIHVYGEQRVPVREWRPRVFRTQALIVVGGYLAVLLSMTLRVWW